MRRLEPFVRLPGRIVYGVDAVHVEPRPFYDRHLNRDLAAVREKVADAQPHLPDGRQLVFTVAGVACPVLDVLRRNVA